MTFEEFCNFYERKGYLPDGSTKSSRRFNEKELKRKYEKFIKKSSNYKKTYTINKKVGRNKLLEKELSDEIKERDNNTCRLFKCLSIFERQDLLRNAGDLFFILDKAHIFSKGSHIDLKYDKDNIVLLNRFSHSALDRGYNPIDGKTPLNREEKEYWWKRIVGEDLYNSLLEKIKK